MIQFVQGQTLSLSLPPPRGGQRKAAAHNSSGHVWQGGFYSCPLDSAHLWIALRYTELNPVRAKLVTEAASWTWSSAAAHLRRTTATDVAGHGNVEQALVRSKVAGASSFQGRRRRVDGHPSVHPYHDLWAPRPSCTPWRKQRSVGWPHKTADVPAKPRCRRIPVKRC
jgi:hypothetical protein